MRILQGWFACLCANRSDLHGLGWTSIVIQGLLSSLATNKNPPRLVCKPLGHPIGSSRARMDSGGDSRIALTFCNKGYARPLKLHTKAELGLTQQGPTWAYELI